MSISFVRGTVNVAGRQHIEVVPEIANTPWRICGIFASPDAYATAFAPEICVVTDLDIFLEAEQIAEETPLQPPASKEEPA